jgi:hypothetical protein
MRRAVVACDRCGRLLCALCDLEVAAAHLCPRCFEADYNRTTSEAPAARPLNGRLALILACVPAFPPTSVAALLLCATTWRKPGSLVRPQKWLYPIAMLIAALQLVAATILLLALTRGR